MKCFPVQTSSPKVSEKQVSKSRSGLWICLYDMLHLIFSTTEHITANECIFFLAFFLSFELKQKLFRSRFLKSASPVRNIPKFKDRANWSCDTFQPMRRRACVYQQTNQNMIKHRCCDQIFSKQRTESDKISHRFEALRHIFKTFHEAYTIFLSG